jgi:hypothetical protein
MAIYSSFTPVFDFYRDDDGVFVCEMTPGMVRELHHLLDAATAMAHEKGRWVPSPCVALAKQLGNAARDLRGPADCGPGESGNPAGA